MTVSLRLLLLPAFVLKAALLVVVSVQIEAEENDERLLLAAGSVTGCFLLLAIVVLASVTSVFDRLLVVVVTVVATSLLLAELRRVGFFALSRVGQARRVGRAREGTAAAAARPTRLVAPASQVRSKAGIV